MSRRTVATRYAIGTVDGTPNVRAVGLRLRWLRMALDNTTLIRAVEEQVSLLSALHGHSQVRFVLQFVAEPAGEEHDAKLRVELLAVASGECQPPTDDDLEELVDDIEDLLRRHQRWYGFTPIGEMDELHAALWPFTPTSVAEVLRREEAIGAALSRHGIGFGTELHSSSLEQLWSFALFPSSPEPRTRLVELLLLQEAPVALRVIVTPTEITVEERAALGGLQHSWPEATRLDTHGLAAQRSIMAMAFVEPNFEVRILLGSTERLSPALVETVGASISPPQPDPIATGPLVGGYAVERKLEPTHFDCLLIESVPPGGEHWLTPPPLRRLRRVMGPWEAAAAFRLPVATGPSFPGLSVRRTPALSAPSITLPKAGLVLGEVEVGGATCPVRMTADDRFRHSYILGQTGTGKSTLLLNLINQDITAGEGVAVIDPHGDLVEAVLGRIPDDRLDDVVLIDPADTEAVVGVNLLEADSEVQAEYLVADLCGFFQQLFDPYNQGIVGPRFQSWLRYACQTLIPVPNQGTICDIPRLFTDDDYLKHCFRYITDVRTQDFWTGEMAQTDFHTKSEMIGWFASKFEPFRTSRLMRGVLGQPRSSISFGAIMDERRILLVKLSKGLMGEYNASLMGYVMFAKLWAAALGRAAQPETERVPFHVYADEFQTMTSPALPAILSEARKFGLSLTMANQFFTQINERVRESILGNVGTKLVFRVGAMDAEAFAAWQGGQCITGEHLRRLPNYLAMANLLVDGEPIEPMLVRTLPPSPAVDHRDELVRARSRGRYAQPRDLVDTIIDATYLNFADFETHELLAEVYGTEYEGVSRSTTDAYDDEEPATNHPASRVNDLRDPGPQLLWLPTVVDSIESLQSGTRVGILVAPDVSELELALAKAEFMIKDDPQAFLAAARSWGRNALLMTRYSRGGFKPVAEFIRTYKDFCGSNPQSDLEPERVTLVVLDPTDWDRANRAFSLDPFVVVWRRSVS